MKFKPGDRVRPIIAAGVPDAEMNGEVIACYSIDREEPHYDIRWDVDGTIGYHLPARLLRSIDTEMRTYCYRSPYPLMLTPEDADITDLLGAVLNLSMTYGEHRQSYSTEVMQAVGAVVALAKRSLKEEA